MAQLSQQSSMSRSQVGLSIPGPSGGVRGSGANMRIVVPRRRIRRRDDRPTAGEGRATAHKCRNQSREAARTSVRTPVSFICARDRAGSRTVRDRRAVRRRPIAMPCRRAWIFASFPPSRERRHKDCDVMRSATPVAGPTSASMIDVPGIRLGGSATLPGGGRVLPPNSLQGRLASRATGRDSTTSADDLACLKAPDRRAPCRPCTPES
jgi:hypothetical protein